MKYNTFLILISLIVLSLIFGYLVTRYFNGFREWDLTANGKSVAKMVSENINDYRFKNTNLQENRREIYQMAENYNYMIGVIDKSGSYIIKSHNEEKFHFPIDQLEIEKILAGNRLVKKIIGNKINQMIMVFPLSKNNNGDLNIVENNSSEKNIIGAIILQTTLGGMTGTFNKLFKLVIISALIALVSAFLINISFTRHFTKPLIEIKNAAINITDGEYTRVNMPNNPTEEIKKMIETFNYAVVQIETNFKKKKRLEKMRKEFVADISHEFRAPLTSIKGFLELFLENDLSKKEIKDYAQIMHHDTEYLEHLVHDLLILGKLDSENIEINVEKTSLNEIIEQTLNSLQTKLDNKDIKIKKTTDPELPLIKVDKMRLHQVMINLLENAISYSPEKGKIFIEVEKIGSEIKVSVIDEGPGLPDDKIDKIWQRFYKIDKARTRTKQKGSGLGLSIVKNIIKKHDGRVEVENTSGKGAKFSFYIKLDNQEKIIG